MYANGTGVSRDDRQAVEWYRKVAEQGLSLAQFNLALMYANGRGVPMSHEEAVKWMRNAAEAQVPAQQTQVTTAVDITGVQKRARQWLKSFEKHRN